jgi:hypothetical protein
VLVQFYMEKEIPEAKSPDSSSATAIEEKPATETSVAAATPATGTKTDDTTGKPPGKTEAGDAVGVEGYEKEEAEFLAESQAAKEKEKAAKWEQAKATAKADEAGSEAALKAEAEGGEQTPVANEGDAPAAEEAVPPAGEETPAAEPTEEEQLRSDKRIRLKGLPDGHLVDAANEIARAENIPFAEAWDRVAPKKAAPAAATQADTAATTTPALRTRAEITADITARKAEKKQAATDYDTGTMYDADESIETLRDELGKVNAAEAAEQTKFSSTVASSKTKAIEYWPEAKDDNSALSKRTVELANAYEKDPALANLVSQADSPFYFTQLAAQELALVPKHLRKEAPAAPAPNGATPPPKPTTSTATKPAPVNQRAVGRPTQPAASPASGAARTTQGGSKIDSALDKVQGVASYEKLEEEFLSGKLASK